jgi:hypothetical protein
LAPDLQFVTGNEQLLTNVLVTRYSHTASVREGGGASLHMPRQYSSVGSLEVENVCFISLPEKHSKSYENIDIFFYIFFENDEKFDKVEVSTISCIKILSEQ